MTPIQRSIARRKLDGRLAPGKGLGPRPARGWIRAIRDALGMTLPQLAGRMQISAPAAIQLEQNEARGAITLATLQRAARALDCELVYALVPRTSLEEMTMERADSVARHRMRSTAHSMALEDQAVRAEDYEDQVRRLARSLLEQPRSGLWNER